MYILNIHVLRIYSYDFMHAFSLTKLETNLIEHVQPRNCLYDLTDYCKPFLCIHEHVSTKTLIRNQLINPLYVFKDHKLYPYSFNPNKPHTYHVLTCSIHKFLLSFLYAFKA